jgi:hypothetical protein
VPPRPSGFTRTRSHSAQAVRCCRWPTERRALAQGSLRIVSGLASEHKLNHLRRPMRLEAANGCPVLREAATTAVRFAGELWIWCTKSLRAPPLRASGDVCFLFTFDLHGGQLSGHYGQFPFCPSFANNLETALAKRFLNTSRLLVRISSFQLPDVPTTDPALRSMLKQKLPEM